MKRVAFYLFWDKEGVVDEYIPYCLQKMREHVEHIVVVSNGFLNADGRQILESIADEVWQRENVGFDVWGYKEAMERFGMDRLVEYDELILANYTFFGPIFPFSEMFTASESWDVDFWGITEHGEVRPHPFAAKTYMPRHLQSHWLAVRQPLLSSSDFREYWETMPMISSYEDSVEMHESRFTEHFANLGYRWRSAYRLEDYPDLNPVLDDVVLLTADRCPILKRRTFFHDPLYMSDKAIIGRDILEILDRESDYPAALIWNNIARTAEPRVAATNFSLTRVYSDAKEVTDEQLDALSKLRALVVIHCFYTDMIDEIIYRVDFLPCERHVVVTTDTAEKKAQLEESLRTRGVVSFEVRVVASNDGRDVSAFLLGCADVLREDYDVVIKLHSKKSPQDGAMASDWFKRNLFDSLVRNENYVASILNLMVERPEIGMVIPPTIALGYPTLGNAWFGNKDKAAEICAKVGISTPLDSSTPLAAYGSMFIARPAALGKLVNGGFDWKDFSGEYGDGSLAHVLERLFTYSSLGAGMPVYTVMSTELAAINYSFLEYRLQNFSQGLPGTVMQQRAYLDSALGVPNLLGVSKGLISMRHPKLAHRLRPVYQMGRIGYRAVRDGVRYAVRTVNTTAQKARLPRSREGR